MITSIEVDGFRSLTEFRMTLEPGLNILVGPNGSGKTNIVTFFEFLTAIFSDRVGEAVNRSGGVGSIFRRSQDGTPTPVLKIKVSGTTRSDTARETRRYIRYLFECEIEFSDILDIVFYKSQKISIQSSASKNAKQPWDMIISTSLSFTEDGPESQLDIEKLDLRKIRSHLVRHVSEHENRDRKIENIILLLKNTHDFESTLMNVAYRIFPEARDVNLDFLSGQALNIVPSVTKRNEDSATPIGIRKDGAGLAATLYALEKIDDPTQRARLRRRTIVTTSPMFPLYGSPRSSIVARGLFQRTVEYLSLVNHEIHGMTVKKDHTDNQLKVLMKLKGKSGDLTLPIAFMSDGTVKWLALVTATFTSREMFAIEEPENFIHPLMQQEIVALIRERGSNKERENFFVLMTTHSETLLNAASPNEIIVVKMEEGVTSAKRPRDRQKIIDEINRSGFGLGYMYLSGLLNNG